MSSGNRGQGLTLLNKQMGFQNGLSNGFQMAFKWALVL
jgi:hypothetical protein